MTIAQAMRTDSDIDMRLLHETSVSLDTRELIQLLMFVLDQSYTFIRTYPDFQLTTEQTEHFLKLKKQLQHGSPLAYVIGRQAFWTLELKVTADTLIPRPDTEMVIITILELLAKDKVLKAIDMGTGTGAIALSLASECPLWQLTATDFSQAALAVAQENALTHDLSNVRFLHGSWFAALPELETFDLIVSNPPYIDPADVHLADLTHEPITALVAQDAGLSDLKMIISQASHYLNADGLLALEHGYDQGQAVRDLMLQSGLVDVRTVRDYGGNERVTLGRKNAARGLSDSNAK
ncbi:MAG: peptide chain release factor N(5)-glutamine methyltransferase [Candidatus Saccharibacteria bacterium]|nr:peptide chain release factor N(5)-glutamine methyltransferase [Moraxellaceae bacterium]